jgi:molybdate transport system regulatory protein
MKSQGKGAAREPGRERPKERVEEARPKEARVSARNRLPGRVVRVRLGEVMAQVTIRVGKHTVDAVITRDSAEELALAAGDRVVALVKSTEIMVVKEVEEGPP